MIPIRDHNPSQRTPYVTWALIGANIIVFVAYLGLFSDDRALFDFFTTYGVVPAGISDGEGYWTLVSSMFLHGGFMHLAGNMLFLWIFGDNLEDRLGHGGFLLFYIASGIGAALAQVAADPASVVPMVGASGAIAGVMGGYLLLYPRARVDILVIFGWFINLIPVPAWSMLALWFVIQLVSGAASATTSGGVAYWAHAGGFIVGLALIAPHWLRSGARSSWRASQGRPPHAEAPNRFTRSRIPTVRRSRRRPGPWS